MKHELEIHTEAVNAKMSHFYEVCSHIIALLSPVRPQTSDKQLSSLMTQVPLSHVYMVHRDRHYTLSVLYNNRISH